MNKKYPFAKRLEHMQGSAIRELLKFGAKPGFIALGGGYPDPKSFPFSLFDKLDKQVKEQYGPLLYQYGKTEGFQPLLDALSLFFKRPNRGFTCDPSRIAITTGSQQALTILAFMFIDQGSNIAVESPTYLGALQAFAPFGPSYIEIPTDDEGIIPEKLHDILKKHQDLKFIYLIPTFQNPTGRCLSLTRRKQIAQLLINYDLLAIEDDPYSEIRYRGNALPSIYSIAPSHVVHLFTFSKTFAPGFRIGGMVGTPEIAKTASMIKQGLDLYTSNYAQAMLAQYLTDNHINPHIEKIIKLYEPRKKTIIKAIKKYFPPDFIYTDPEGGMFTWVESRKKFNVPIRTILDECIEKNVGFVPGDPFYAGTAVIPFSMRLNFTNQTEENIEKGVQVIGEVLNKHKK